MSDSVASRADDEYQALLNCVARNGGTISNNALRQRLGWDRDRYFRVRDVLVDDGKIIRGRGRGGTVRRNLVSAPSETAAVASELAQDAQEAMRSEQSLYSPMQAVIEGDWAFDHRTKPIAVEITAQQGSRSTGGTWSRPDLVSVEVRTYTYVPGKHIEVITFEVKSAGRFDVQAVYEALAHRRAATHSYVLLHVPPNDSLRFTDMIDEIADVARDHGIGLVTIGDPNNYETWDEREEAQRFEPDFGKLDRFIASQLSRETKDQLARALR